MDRADSAYLFALGKGNSMVLASKAGMPEPPNVESGRPKLLDQVRAAIRLRHYSRRTEESYVGWIRRYIVFHGKRHPLEMGATEVAGFLTHLAERARVSASTQNQALCRRRWRVFWINFEV